MLNPFKDRRTEADPEAEEGKQEAPTDVEEGAGDSRIETADERASAGTGDAATAARAGREGDEAADEGVAEAEGGIEAELADLRDRHLRLAAEFENFRKRTRREASTGRTVAQAELVRQILPTLDDLARVADTPHESTTVEALDEGIELILRNLRKQLGDAGLVRIEAQDERFDPERHQAVLTTATDDPDLDETISRVLVDGYDFQGRLVRPAQVEVRRYEEDAGDGDADGTDAA